MNGSPTPIVIGSSLGVDLGSAWRPRRRLGDRAAAARGQRRERCRTRRALQRHAEPGTSPRARLDLVAGQAAEVVGLRAAEARGSARLSTLSSALVLPEAEPEGHDQRDHADDQPRAELVEVVDDAQTVLVTDRPQDAGHRRRPRAAGSGRPRRPARVTARARTRPRPSRDARRWTVPRRGRDGGLGRRGMSVSLSLVLVLGLPGDPSLNSRIPRPRRLPSSGRRLGPKMSRTITRTTIRSVIGLRNIRLRPPWGSPSVAATAGPEGLDDRLKLLGRAPIRAIGRSSHEPEPRQPLRPPHRPAQRPHDRGRPLLRDEATHGPRPAHLPRLSLAARPAGRLGRDRRRALGAHARTAPTATGSTRASSARTRSTRSRIISTRG